MSFTVQEKQIAMSYAKNGAEFMFMPSSSLCSLIAKDHISTREINKQLKLLLLQKKAIRIESSMIMKYCDGTLDKKNKWILDQGDIKVVPPQFETKIKEKKDE